MKRFFFHATDGFTLLIDEEGRRLSGRPVGVVAGEVADEIRGRFGPGADLAEWAITVQDEFGCSVEAYGFDELAREAEVLTAA